MILNFEQWIRLQDNVYDAKNWFAGVGLFKGYIETFQKIAYVTRHELSQIRGEDYWVKEFCKDIPEDKRLPLNLVLNFGNFRKQIDWPWDEEANLKLTQDFRNYVGGDEDWQIKWRVKHSLCGSSHETDTFLHYVHDDFGGVVWVVETNPYNEYYPKEQLGIVINEKHAKEYLDEIKAQIEEAKD